MMILFSRGVQNRAPKIQIWLKSGILAIASITKACEQCPPQTNMGAPLMNLRPAVLVFAAALLTSLCVGQSPKPDAPSHRESAVRPEDRVDLNHATLDQLLKIPGMTRTWAQRIIRFRPYRSKQDLVEQGILPADVYNRIRDYVIAHREKD